VVHEGAFAGHTIEDIVLPAVIGRGTEANVRLPDSPTKPTISRRHLVLAMRAGRLTCRISAPTAPEWEAPMLVPGEAVIVSESTPIWLGQETMITVGLVNALAPEPLPAEPASSGTRGPGLALTTLGSVRVVVDGHEVDSRAWQSRKPSSFWFTWFTPAGPASRIISVQPSGPSWKASPATPCRARCRASVEPFARPRPPCPIPSPIFGVCMP